ncbi:MAG: TIGR00730 family Rossman fold protein [Snowella sp.]
MNYFCVFCGSSLGNQPIYELAAQAMGKAIASRNLGLVYGGGRVGLMGKVADAVLTAGGQVIGVIPDFLATKEIAHWGLTKLHIVGSMHERKALMASLSSGFIALPGGYGTLEEFCEVLTWGQLGLHEKSLALLNIAGYYNPLLAFFDRALAEGFLSRTLRSLILEATTPDILLDAMISYQPEKLAQWLENEAEI